VCSTVAAALDAGTQSLREAVRRSGQLRRTLEWLRCGGRSAIRAGVWGVICRRGVFPQRVCRWMRAPWLTRREAVQRALREECVGHWGLMRMGWVVGGLRERRV